MATKIKYNDETLVSLTSGQYAILKTNGKVLDNNIRIEVDKQSSEGGSGEDGKATIATVATKEEMDALFATPPEQIANGGQTIVQYTGETGTYTKNAYYVVEVSE